MNALNLYERFWSTSLCLAQVYLSELGVIVVVIAIVIFINSSTYSITSATIAAKSCYRWRIISSSNSVHEQNCGSNCSAISPVFILQQIWSCSNYCVRFCDFAEVLQNLFNVAESMWWQAPRCCRFFNANAISNYIEQKKAARYNGTWSHSKNTRLYSLSIKVIRHYGRSMTKIRISSIKSRFEL